jgi:transcriptional regulator with XRE-family HTH domain
MMVHAAPDDGVGLPRPVDTEVIEDGSVSAARLGKTTPLGGTATVDRADPFGRAAAAGEGDPVNGTTAARSSSALSSAEAAGNPLQRLIQRRLREQGWSYGQVARRGGLPRSTVYTLATTRNLVRPPRPATIDALARGLDVPVSAVRAAAAESTGLHYYDQPAAGHPGDPERELLIASIDELSPEDRRHVAALVESLRRRESPPADH